MINDDDFCFDVSPSDSSTEDTVSHGAISYNTGRQNSFTRTAVTRNMDTGEITGWQEFYRLVCMDTPSLQSSMDEAYAEQQKVIKQW